MKNTAFYASRTLFLLVLISMLSSTVQASMTEEKLEEIIQFKISERHPTDTPDWWKRLGPDAPKVIMSMYGRTKKTYEQIRLLSALAWYDDAAALEFIKAQTQAATNETVRSAGIRTMGFSQGAKEADFIAKYLSHADPQTRLTAAKTLKRIDAAAADQPIKDHLEKWKKSEKTAWVVAGAEKPLPKNAGGAEKWEPVSTSEKNDPVNDPWMRLSGKWMGLWVMPVSSSSKTLVTFNATLEVRKNGGAWSAKITFDSMQGRKTPKTPKAMELKDLKMQPITENGASRMQISGKYLSVASGPSGGFTGRLKETTDRRAFYLEIPDLFSSLALIHQE